MVIKFINFDKADNLNDQVNTCNSFIKVLRTV